MKVQCFKELKLESSVVAIGAFDGLHKGHQEIIKQTVKQSKRLNVPSVIYTFDVPPKAYFKGHRILSRQQDKLNKLQKLGVDYVIVAKFDSEYLKRSAMSFVDELYLMNPLNIFVGEDFKFGYKQSGNINLLKKYYHVDTVTPVLCSEGKTISSTRIRQLLSEGKCDQINSFFS